MLDDSHQHIQTNQDIDYNPNWIAFPILCYLQDLHFHKHLYYFFSLDNSTPSICQLYQIVIY